MLVPVMQSDYHIHTFLCGHASGKPEDYVATAVQKGITEICFTDHAPAPCGYDPENRMTIVSFPEYRKIVSSLQKDSPVNILYGIEADFYDGCMDFLPAWLNEQDFDIVLGSVHYIDKWGFDDPRKRSIWSSVDITETWRKYFKLTQQMAETGLYDVVSHLDLPKKFGHRPPETDIMEMAEPALKKIAEAGMSIELNSSGLRRPVKEIYPSLLLLKMARSLDITICFGSDSHEPCDIGYCFDESLSLAKEAGFTHYARYAKRTKIMTPLP